MVTNKRDFVISPGYFNVRIWIKFTSIKNIKGFKEDIILNCNRKLVKFFDLKAETF
jgi:hypothetical protein